MIGLWSAAAPKFLIALAAVTTPAFAIPICFAPLRWAKLMMWRLPEDRDLAVYFGRCLGAFILVIEFMAVRSGLTGERLLITFQCLTMVWIFMIAVHMVGALEGSQPMTETLEIGLWVVFLVLSLLFWPSVA